MRYRIKPKEHLHGKTLKRFYRDLSAQIPWMWQSRPTIIITIIGNLRYTHFEERK